MLTIVLFWGNVLWCLGTMPSSELRGQSLRCWGGGGGGHEVLEVKAGASVDKPCTLVLWVISPDYITSQFEWTWTQFKFFQALKDLKSLILACVTGGSHTSVTWQKCGLIIRNDGAAVWPTVMSSACPCPSPERQLLWALPQTTLLFLHTDGAPGTWASPQPWIQLLSCLFLVCSSFCLFPKWKQR